MYNIYTLLHELECNNYGEIFHECTLYFHEPKASENITYTSEMSRHITR